MKKSTVAMVIASALELTHHLLYAAIALGLVLLGALGIATAHAAGTWTATGSLSESELTEFNSENFSFNSVNSDSK